jgi:hypothetical protein
MLCAKDRGSVSNVMPVSLLDWKEGMSDLPEGLGLLQVSGVLRMGMMGMAWVSGSLERLGLGAWGLGTEVWGLGTGVARARLGLGLGLGLKTSINEAARPRALT